MPILSTNKLFVLRPLQPQTPAVQPSIVGGAPIEALKSPLGGWVTAVPEIAHNSSAREQWAQLQQQVGNQVQVLPAELSPDGSVRYPTGLLGVRFGRGSMPADVDAWATRHGLALVGRNRYVPTQAMFRMTDPVSQFPSDLAAQIDSSPEVERAWLDAESIMHRRDPT